MKNYRPARSRALTLLEMIVALVLATLLMMALTGLMRSVSQASQTAAKPQPSSRALLRLRQQLQRDCLNARFYQASDKQLRLLGFLGTDGTTGRASWQWAEVTWQIVERQETQLLIRHEQTLRQTPPRRRIDPMWSGVGSLQVVSYDDAEEDTENGGASHPSGMKPAGSLFMVSFFDRQGQLILEETVFHHMDF